VIMLLIAWVVRMWRPRLPGAVGLSSLNDYWVREGRGQR
jgi:hypothetical protein